MQFLGGLFTEYSSVGEGGFVVVDMEINRFFIIHTQVASHPLTTPLKQKRSILLRDLATQ